MILTPNSLQIDASILDKRNKRHKLATIQGFMKANVNISSFSLLIMHATYINKKEVKAFG